MKTYPSIPSKVIKGQTVYMFDKLDGSNIRVEWTKKNGFFKFGSRRRLLGTDQFEIHKSPQLLKSYEEEFERIFLENKWQKVTLFFEFYGPSSFAGTHNENEEHELFLIDVNVYKKGIMNPSLFLKLFGHMNIAKFLYYGNITHDIEESIRNGVYEGVTSEGVVCKYIAKGRQWKSFKIKTNDWYAALKKKCGDDDKKFELLK